MSDKKGVDLKPGGEKQDFTPPASQDELDRIVSNRLERERAKYADYEDLKAKAAKFDELEDANKSELEKAQARAQAAEEKVQQFEKAQQISDWKTKVSKDTGVPVELLFGESEDELKAHAEKLKPHLATSRSGPVDNKAGTQPESKSFENSEFVRGLFGRD